MTATLWTDHPDKVVAGVYWVRWKATQGTNRWHATRDGKTTLCDLPKGVWGMLYVGRQPERCAHCLRRVVNSTTPRE